MVSSEAEHFTHLAPRFPHSLAVLHQLLGVALECRPPCMHAEQLEGMGQLKGKVVEYRCPIIFYTEATLLLSSE